MKVFAFMYNPMIEESGWITISLHQTKKGAKIAMKFHKAKERKEWKEHDKWQRKKHGKEYELLKGSKFGRWENWRVEEMEVLQ